MPGRHARAPKHPFVHPFRHALTMDSAVPGARRPAGRWEVGRPGASPPRPQGQESSSTDAHTCLPRIMLRADGPARAPREPDCGWQEGLSTCPCLQPLLRAPRRGPPPGTPGLWVGVFHGCCLERCIRSGWVELSAPGPQECHLGPLSVSGGDGAANTRVPPEATVFEGAHLLLG